MLKVSLIEDLREQLIKDFYFKWSRWPLNLQKVKLFQEEKNLKRMEENNSKAVNAAPIQLTKRINKNKMNQKRSLPNTHMCRSRNQIRVRISLAHIQILDRMVDVDQWRDFRKGFNNFSWFTERVWKHLF